MNGPGFFYVYPPGKGLVTALQDTILYKHNEAHVHPLNQQLMHSLLYPTWLGRTKCRGTLEPGAAERPKKWGG